MTSPHPQNPSSSTCMADDERGAQSSSLPNHTLVTNGTTFSTNDTNKGGYEYEFVDGTDSKFECPICLHCLRDPVLTTCGHRFCSGCIHQWVVEQDGKCPVDSVSLSPENIFPDNYTRREIMACPAKCPFSSAKDSTARCTVVLPVSDLEKHIEAEHSGFNLMTLNGSGILECPFKDVGCTVNFREDQREKHLEKEVHKHLQLLRTAYSRLKVLSSSRTNLEYPPEYSRQDSRDSTAWLLGDESLSPEDYQFRRQRSWDSVRFARKQNVRPTTSRCLASSSGSQAWLPVSEESLCHQQQQHPHAPPPASLPQFQRLVPYTPTSSHHRHHRHSQGDKEGADCGAASGSPEKGKLNGQSSPGGGGGGGVDPHLQDLFQRLVISEQKDQEKQIKINKLEAELNSVLNLFSTTAQIIKDFTARYCNGVYVWKIPNFRRLCLDMRRNPNRVLNSPGFYTDTFGYKLCLRFNLTTPALTTSSGGSGGGGNAPVDVPLEQDEDTFISLYVHFMQGEFDDTLTWPFHGQMKLMVIHPTIPEDSVVELMSSKPEAAAFAKPTLPRSPKGFGYLEFCPIHKIFANGFVKEDTIVFKILAKSVERCHEAEHLLFGGESTQKQ